MSEFTWGDLPKSQIDNQLITEAITEAIIAHEEDPTAHLGDGESLDQHKTNEVLDHPQASVIADKVGASDYIFNFSFESIDYFPDSVRLFLDYAGSPYLYLEYGVANSAYCTFTIGTVNQFYNENKIMTLSFASLIETSSTHLTGFFGFGNLRFSIISGVLKARFYRDTSYNEVNLSAIDITDPHFYKIIFLPVDDVAYFYVDGILVASIERPAGSPVVGGEENIFDFDIVGGTEHIVRFSNVQFTRSL